MTSEERPFSSHVPEERFCAFCGELFYAHHGLQQYCPEKHGRKNYCKYEQKKLLNEKRLAETAERLALANIPIYQQADPLKKNIEILRAELGPYGQQNISQEFLETKGYDINSFSTKIKKGENDEIALVVGPFLLEWIDTNGESQIFKLSRT